MKKKKSILAIIMSLTISLNPLLVSAHWLDNGYFRIKFGEELYLSPEKPYLKTEPNSNTFYAVENCNLENDETCVAFFDNETSAFTKYLYLSNYIGPEIKYEPNAYEELYIISSGTNLIKTSNEYGLSCEISNSARCYLYGNETAKSEVKINVKSSTKTANGIRSTGDVWIGNNLSLSIDIDSALPKSEVSTSNVTGITVGDNNSIVLTEDSSNITINNPTGNYSMYGGTYSVSRNDFACKDTVPCSVHGKFTHKITNGIGDFFNNNDFEGNSTPDSPKVIGPSPTYTFSHVKTEKIGTFTFYPAITGVNAIFDEEVYDGEDFPTAETRFKESLKRDDDRESVETYGLGHGCKSDQFEVDPENSYLENLTHPENRTIISKDDQYLFWISFRSTDDKHAFTLDWEGPHSYAVINDKLKTAQFSPFVRSEDAFTELFGYELSILAKNNNETNEEPDPEPIETTPETPQTPEEPLLPDPEEPIAEIVERNKQTEIRDIVKTEESPVENPQTNARSEVQALVILLFSFVIQLGCYGKVIFSIRRHGLRKNHATSPSRL